jgi:phage-related protein
MKTIRIRKGEKLTIRAIAFETDDNRRDKCPTLAFFQEQAHMRQREFDKLAALLTETAEKGPLHNDTKFKDLPGSDELYEFKTTGGLRLFCFWDDGSLIICTHGYIKGSQKTPKREIERAEQMRKAYLEAKKLNQLTHVEPKAKKSKK